MANSLPQCVTHQELAARLDDEVGTLRQTELAWWSAHRVTPFPALHKSSAHFVVAVHGNRAIFFADDEDEFGVARLVEENQSISDYGLVGDLRDAVRIIAGIVV